MIPGKRLRRATLRDFDGTGLVEFASAARRQPGEIFIVRVPCRIKMDPAWPFTEVRPISGFRPQPL